MILFKFKNHIRNDNRIENLQQLKPRCSRCGGSLYCDNDDYEKYFTCIMCAREYNLDITSRQMNVKEFEERIGLKVSTRNDIL